MVLSIFLRWHFLYLGCRVDDTEDENGRTDIKGIDHGVGDDSQRRLVGDAQQGEEVGEDVARNGTGVAEERLYGVGERLLLLVDHVAHQHLERLHGHVDARVEKHQREQSEYHCRRYRHAERPGIGQQAHHEDGNGSPDEEIGYAPSEACPCLVGQCPDDRLYDDAHQRREYPEIAEFMWVSTQCREDAGDVCALQRIGNLHSEESETEIPELPET